MRKIQTQDVFKLARIMKQTKLKDQISELVKKGNEISNSKAIIAKEGREKAKEQFGIEVALALIEECADPKAEKLIYEFIAGIAEKQPKDIETQSLQTTIEQIQQIVSENNIMNFFNTASRLTM